MSLTAFFVKAVAYGLQKTPEMNARLEGDNLDELVIYDSVNVGVGMSTPKGLIVAVVKDAQNKSLDQISEELNDLVDRARANKLRMEDIQGSTVTISNLANTNSVAFSSIINNNETLIIGFGRIKKEVIVDDNGEIAIANIGRMIVNMNHTATSGLPTAMATEQIKLALESPEEYLL